MRDPNRSSESCRAHHRRPRTSGRSRHAPGRVRMDTAFWPLGRALAFDAPVPERRGGGGGDERGELGDAGGWPGEERRAAEPWQGPERRVGDRRRTDRRVGPERRSGQDRRSLLGQARELATRFKEPLIGLGVAAAAMPALKATSNAERMTSGVEEHAAAPAQAAREAVAAAAPNRDIDAEVGARWATSDRSTTVQAAVDKYGISPELASQIYDHARNAGVDPKMAYGLVKTESDFKHTAVSHVGARGLTQLMPGTARWLQPGTSAADLFNPETSLQVGFKYLRQLIDRYAGNTHLALTAYNRGPGIVDRAVSRGRDPDNGYAGAVLGNALHGGDVSGPGGTAQQPG